MATRRRRTPAQKAATRKLVALNRRRARMKTNPAKKTRRKRPIGTRQYAKSMATRRTPTTRLRARRRKNRVRGYYPNPRRRTNMIQNIISRQLQPAAIQAGGALGLDVIMGYFGNFIPAQLNQGMMRHVTKGVVALGMGFVVSNFVRNATANEMSKGALTVVMHDAFREALQQWMPAIPLGYCDSDMGYYNPSPVYEPTSQNMNMGYFQTGAGSGYAPHTLGYFSQDTGSGYGRVRAGENDLFDTADI